MLKNSDNDTIAAVSTPSGNGGISIIRISGDKAAFVIRNIFITDITKKELSLLDTDKMVSHTVKHGYIYDVSRAQVLDEVLLTFFKAPRSYTMEDIYEINCHGGYNVTASVLRLIFSTGYARPAEPGEFTKRAFLNGRIDLSEAEAVMDLIEARTDESRRAAVDQLSGRLAKSVRAIKEKLTLALANMEVAIDYPEYESDEDTASNAIEILKGAEKELKELSGTYSRGRILKEGLKVVIAGRPNAGKSTMLNRMLGYDRAIVTDIPGTTRDVIEECAQYMGLPLILTDTAGLRESADTVESIGIQRAHEELDRADIVIYVVDVKEETEAVEKELAQAKSMCGDKPFIAVCNKTDSIDDTFADKAKKKLSAFDPIYISLLQGETEGIYERIGKCIADRGLNANSEIVLTNERHKQLIDKALASLECAKKSYSDRLPIDCISYDIWECAGFLSGITGDNISDDVIEIIFSRFCLGK